MDSKGGGESSPINFELPPQPTPEGENQSQERAAETAPAAPEQTGKQAKQPALPSIPDDIPAADQPVISAPADDDEASQAAEAPPHPEAKDVEHIERQWVDKVKDVVAKTQD